MKSQKKLLALARHNEVLSSTNAQQEKDLTRLRSDLEHAQKHCAQVTEDKNTVAQKLAVSQSTIDSLRNNIQK